MKKFIKRLILFVLAAAIILSAVVCIPIIKKGRNMYLAAVATTPMEQKVEQLRSDEDYVTIENISDDFKKLLVESEDRRFYSHGGIDIISIGRATLNNIKAGELVEGGSTITQQLVKNMYFTFDKVFARKVAEVYAAFEMEKKYSKDEILELYCNAVYFGENCYGIGEACRYYFGCSPSEITYAQAKELVETLKAPSISNPETMR